ncbi:MAG: hypothetical protein ACP5XB_14275 [Isosphaeraceae bacterium]
MNNVFNSPALSGNSNTTLSATLTNTSAGTPISGQTVTFTVTHDTPTVVTGSGTTDSSGVASASVSTTGMATGDTITASYAGNTNHESANGTGTIA